MAPSIVMTALAFMAAMSVLTAAQAQGQSPDWVWDWIKGLSQMTPQEFGERVAPLMQIAINTYRSRRSALNVTGWAPATRVRPLLPSDATDQAGIHAVVYEHVRTGVLVVSFRGAKSAADFCAACNVLGTGGAGATGDCARYSAASLDYPAQALRYARRVLQVYSGRPVLLSGHSMGSALAQLTSAAIFPETVPVLSFSGPLDAAVLESRGLWLRAADAGAAYVVSDRWDPFGFPVGGPGAVMERHVGVLCALMSPEPPACSACRASDDGRRNPLMASGACAECFGQTHPLEPMLALAQGAAPFLCRPGLH